MSKRKWIVYAAGPKLTASVVVKGERDDDRTGEVAKVAIKTLQDLGVTEGDMPTRFIVVTVPRWLPMAVANWVGRWAARQAVVFNNGGRAYD